MQSMQTSSVLQFAEFMKTISAAPVRWHRPHGGRGPLRSSESPDPTRVCHDGERTNHLVRLAGMWVGKGYDIEDVVTLALEWNRRNQPPLAKEKVTSTCRSILRTHENNHVTIADAEIAPLFDLESARAARFLDTDPPPRRWLLDSCLPLGKVGMVAAKGGTGKSQLLLQLAISVATGEALAGEWRVGESGAVLALFAEDDEEEIQRRFHICINSITPQGVDQAEFFQSIRNNLFIKSMVAESNLMTVAGEAREVVQTDYVRRLLLAVHDLNNLRLIIIDPASRFRGGEENKAEDGTRFVEALEQLAKEKGATVLVAHHVRKGSGNSSEQSQEAARGSSALSDGVRWQMNLTGLTGSEATKYGLPADEHGFYLKAAITKNNYAAPQSEVVLKRGDGGYLRRADLVPVKLAKEQDVYSKIVEIVREETARNRQYSKAAFEDKFGGENGPLKTGRLAVRKILKDAVSSDRLVLVRKKLAVPGEPTSPKRVISGTAAPIAMYRDIPAVSGKTHG